MWVAKPLNLALNLCIDPWLNPILDFRGALFYEMALNVAQSQNSVLDQPLRENLSRKHKS